MAYCTQSDLEDRYSARDLVRVADHDADGVADAGVIEQACDDATGIADSYLGMLYSIPLATVPDVVRYWTTRLAWCCLLEGRQSLSEEQQKLCAEAHTWFKGVAAGSISVGLNPTPGASASAPGVAYHVDDREFGRDKALP